jgi:hypothetical protein
MATSILMKNDQTGVVKQGFYGFSWTYLFFGFWVPLFRGNIGMFGLHFLLAIVSVYTLWIPQIIMAFFFNKFYTIDLIERGYDFVEKDEAKLQAASISLGIAK